MNPSGPTPSFGTHRGTRLLLLIVLAVGVFYPLLLVAHAHGVNGRHGFPLDESWVDLTYARNLKELGRMCYTPGASASAGSSSPLHTLLLTAGFFFTHDESRLGYTLSLLAQAVCLVFVFVWARARLRSLTWASIATLLVALDARFGILAASGMETTLFCAFVAMAFWCRATGRWTSLGWILGISIWARPEGLLLAVVLAADISVDRTLAQKWGTKALPRLRSRQRALSLGFLEDPKPVEKPPNTRQAQEAAVLAAPESSEAFVPVASRRALTGIIAVTALFAVLYAVYNLSLGGGPLPNTFAARTARFAEHSRLWFIARDIPIAFSANGWLLLFPIALLQAGWEVREAMRRRPGFLRAENTWWTLLSLAYLFALPSSGDFSRYLVPALPAVGLLGIGGLRRLAYRIQHGRGALGTRGATWRWSSTGGSAAGVVLVVSVALQLRGAILSAEEYQERTHYHYVREERTALWIAEHTDPAAVVATHAIGAIGFYSERDVFDLTGTTRPQLLRHLGNPSYVGALEEAFFVEGITHLAVVRSWLEVDNVRPIFVADPVEEVLEVYAWEPSRTHLVPPAITERNALAFEALELGDFELAIQTLEESVRLDSQSSRVWFLLGVANELARRLEPAVEAYREAVARFPRFSDAWFQLTRVFAQQARWENAYESIQQLMVYDPNYPGAAEVRTRIEHELVSREIQRDSVRP